MELSWDPSPYTNPSAPIVEEDDTAITNEVTPIADPPQETTNAGTNNMTKEETTTNNEQQSTSSSDGISTTPKIQIRLSQPEVQLEITKSSSLPETPQESKASESDQKSDQTPSQLVQPKLTKSRSATPPTSSSPTRLKDIPPFKGNDNPIQKLETRMSSMEDFAVISERSSMIDPGSLTYDSNGFCFAQDVSLLYKQYQESKKGTRRKNSNTFSTLSFAFPPPQEDKNFGSMLVKLEAEVQSHLNKKKVASMVQFGTLTPEQRAQLWIVGSGAQKRKESANLNSKTGCYYAELLVKLDKNPDMMIDAFKDIEKDLPRTFPYHKWLHQENAISVVRRILRAFARHNKSVRYCQGLNYIVAFALVIMGFDNEENIFWLLVCIIEDMLPGFFSETMLNLQVHQQILEDNIREKLPALHSVMENLCVSVPLFSTKWFLCLFTTVLPSETCAAVWDHIFWEGNITMIYKVGMSILKLQEEVLSKVDNANGFVRVVEYSCASLFDPLVLIKAVQKMTTLPFDKIEDLRVSHLRNLKKQLDDINKRKDISVLLKETNFSRGELETLRNQFMNILKVKKPLHFASEHSSLNEEQFAQIICEHIFPGRAPTDPGLAQLFKIFDRDGNGEVDFRELMLGLSIMTKGSQDERLEMCFRSYDLDNSGYLQKDELFFMLKNVYESVNNFSKKNPSEHKSPIHESINTKQQTLVEFVDMCFKNLDSNNDQKLSFEEFKKILVIEPLLIQYINYCKPIEEEQTQTMRIKGNRSASGSILSFSGNAEVAAPRWQPDESATTCNICADEFFFFRRKHHCRMCGLIICNDCSPNRTPIPKFGFVKPVRICVECEKDNQ